MKIIELEINNIRGIRNLTLTPKGKTFVVWGPNGTGKSGVIDSIDFLLTGKITRLSGKGTGGLSLKTHGSHIDTSGEDAYVKAKVKINGIKDSIELTRKISNPQILDVVGCDKKLVEPISNLALRGQHVLTRREILEYITSEPANRAQQIQTLLNILEIDRIRKNFVKVANNASNSVKATAKALEQARVASLATVGKREFSTESILSYVNLQRAVLKGQAIDKLQSDELKSGITAPKLISTADKNITLIEKQMENLLGVKEKSGDLENANIELTSAIRNITADPKLLASYRRKQLIELGLKTIANEDTSDCPLCDTEWKESALAKYLEQKLEGVEQINALQLTISKNTDILRREVSFIKSNLKGLLSVVNLLPELESERKMLSDWNTHLSSLEGSIEDPISNYLNFDIEGRTLKNILSPNNLPEIIEITLSILKEKFPKSSPDQDAWDTLTKLGENVKAIEASKKEYEDSKLFQKRAEILKTEFEKSRDKVLTELYTSIQDRFAELYVGLHGDDEKGFSAKLEPKGAALNFEVDFYGRGSYPPHALHSEGHQDSMGLCLFLALAEFLADGIIDVILLDDVVMSVDAEHRRGLCKLLHTHFGDKQFVITTHDQTWARQLGTEGLVSSKTSIEFYNWDIESGPHVNFEVDMWDKIKTALEKNDISQAAAKLRKGAEGFFESMCDSLGAKLIYRKSRRWDLGSYMPAAYNRYKELLQKAMTSAQSWGKNELTREISEVVSKAGQVYRRTDAESWGVNSNVHHNEWSNFTKEDFEPIVEAFEDLFNVFICQTCKTTIHTVSRGMQPESLKCKCAEINWNLIKKNK